MADEIKVEAKLNTYDFENGLLEIKQVVRDIQEVVGNALDPQAAKAAEKGAEAGTDFTKGFLSRLLLRDVISEVLSGISQAFRGASDEITKLTNVKINFSPWERLKDIMVAIAFSSKAIGDSVKFEADRNISNIKMAERHRIELDRLKENPRDVDATTHQIEQQLERAHKKKAEDQINNQKYNKARVDMAAHEANPLNTDAVIYRQGADVTDEELKRRDAVSNEKIAYLTQKLAYSKQSDAVRYGEEVKENSHAAARIIAERALQVKRDNDNIDETERENTEYASRREKEKHHERQIERISLDNEGDAVSKTKRGAEHNLNQDEHALEHLKATSTTRINGGLYGRNDSAQALVQNAAKQVSILGSIDAHLAEIKKAKQDLSLLP